MSLKDICRTEEYAIDLAKKERKWHDQYDSLIDEKIAIFNKIIRFHTAQAYDLLDKLINDPMTEEVQTKNTLYAYMVIFIQVYRAERSAGEHRVVFDYGDSLEELIDVFQQIKFWLWELEFLREKDTERILNQFVKEYAVSQELLRSMILIACMDKDGMRQKVSAITGMAL